MIDVDYIRRLVTYRRRQTGRPEELGYVIAELGGPGLRHFRREHARARGQTASLAADAFAATPRARPACSLCAAGGDVLTYDHRRS